MLHILLNKCSVFCHIHITQRIIDISIVYTRVLCRVNNITYNNPLVSWI
nr:MAG TPA: hypothetical protein [Caudoviricetes sp.]